MAKNYGEYGEYGDSKMNKKVKPLKKGNSKYREPVMGTTYKEGTTSGKMKFPKDKY